MTSTLQAPTYADGLREALAVVQSHLAGDWSGVDAVAAELERRLGHLETTAAGRGAEGMTRAARRWTVAQGAQVDAAIHTVAARNARGPDPWQEFTTADVWAELGEGFPVTKGIAPKMLAAQRAGVIVNTGRVTFNDHPRHDHAHGQRLALWRAGAGARSAKVPHYSPSPTPSPGSSGLDAGGNP